MSSRIVYLMRGLPCCGKSYTARRLAGDTGVVFETDEYFYKCINDPETYDYSAAELPQARAWNFDRFVKAIHQDVSPIVVDRGNDRSAETYRYARFALDYGYQVELKEPESEWWQEIRVLLKYRPDTLRVLYEWADRLSEQSRTHHRIPASLIRKGIEQWNVDLTIHDILAFGESREN